jgi:hypothetical protein
MAEKQNFKIWLAVNEDGDSACSMEGAGEARESLTEDYGGAMIRVVELQVAMALPKIAVAKIDVADEAGEIEASAA